MFRINAILFDFVSPLAMAEWIEICGFFTLSSGFGMSPLAMAEWIEITAFPTALIPFLSPLAMAEWIEISRISKPKLH